MSNNISNSNKFNETIFTKAEDISTKALFILIFMVNITGNSILLLVISKHKRIRNTVNLLLVNLAVSDIISGISVFPFLFIESHSDVLCGMTEGLPIFHAASMVNFLTLSILSLSRYMLINHPTRPKWRIRKSSVKWLALVTWIVGISLMTPNIVFSKFNETERICEDHWVKGFIPKATFIATNVISFAALLALTFTYLSTVYTLWFKPSTRRLTRSNSVSSMQSSRKRISLLLGMLIVAFLFCWLPFAIYLILSAGIHYFPNTVQGYVFKARVKRFTVLVAFLNTCMDPIFYALGNRQIREEAMKTLANARSTNGEHTMIAFE